MIANKWLVSDVKYTGMSSSIFSLELYDIDTGEYASSRFDLGKRMFIDSPLDVRNVYWTERAKLALALVNFRDSRNRAEAIELPYYIVTLE